MHLSNPCCCVEVHADVAHKLLYNQTHFTHTFAALLQLAQKQLKQGMLKLVQPDAQERSHQYNE